jgi:hypothetical protein
LIKRGAIAALSIYTKSSRSSRGIRNISDRQGSACGERGVACGGRKPAGFASCYHLSFIRGISDGRAEHRIAEAVLEINGSAIKGETLGARNASETRCSARRGRCRIKGEDEDNIDWGRRDIEER